MFTGIVTAIGTVSQVDQRGDLRLRITAPFDPARIDIGASIACSGVCLTVVAKGGEPGDAWFDVDVSGETVSRTFKGMWEEGAKLNLEPSLRLGDELGGHIVTGHVDCVGEVVSGETIGDSWKLIIRAPQEMAPYIAGKGSITVNGVSLTVNEVHDQADGACDFMLNIIPHTAEVTTLGDLKAGDQVNLEIDVLARYLKRMQGLAAQN
ncbi:riboflavin synthase [Erythrobacter sp. SCSIO 43205]|uniref:riboflavin synthase n=1 Tax=Erythrobacter sp. SCSIO 43205 TaxID=2779361 RepID=UPI001CA7F796|nr:riboflavin synthase [Erythrobacter sp. SCSIO 43205]UAB78873.1 riboflavin synthase [Erythrobacter sp. SCSIO 43205]